MGILSTWRVCESRTDVAHARTFVGKCICADSTIDEEVVLLVNIVSIHVEETAQRWQSRNRDDSEKLLDVKVGNDDISYLTSELILFSKDGEIAVVRRAGQPDISRHGSIGIGDNIIVVVESKLPEGYDRLVGVEAEVEAGIGSLHSDTKIHALCSPLIEECEVGIGFCCHDISLKVGFEGRKRRLLVTSYTNVVA